MTCKHIDVRVLATRTDEHGVKTRTRLCTCGFRFKTWEIPQGLVNPRDITALIRKAAAGRGNLQPDTHMLDADRVDQVLAALDAGETHASISKRLKISTKTIQRAKRGARRSTSPCSTACWPTSPSPRTIARAGCGPGTGTATGTAD